MLAGIIIGAKAFTAFLLLHWVLIHWRVVKAEFRNVAALWLLCLVGGCCACGGAAALSWNPAVVGHPLVRGFTVIMIMAGCFVLYMPFYYVVATSLSVQTMILVEEAGAEGQPLLVLEDIFAGRNVLEKRLDIMVQNGYLVQEGDRFRVSRKGACISRMFLWLKIMWRLGPGG